MSEAKIGENLSEKVIGHLSESDLPDPFVVEQERLLGVLCAVTECAEMVRRNIEAAWKVATTEPTIMVLIKGWAQCLEGLTTAALATVEKITSAKRT